MRQVIEASLHTASHNRRRDRRIELDAVSEISVNGRMSKCRIVNISSGGALIESAAIPALGSHVRLEVPGLGPAAATVARATSTYYAVVFVTPIDLSGL